MGNMIPTSGDNSIVKTIADALKAPFETLGNPSVPASTKVAVGSGLALVGYFAYKIVKVVYNR